MGIDSTWAALALEAQPKAKAEDAQPPKRPPPRNRASNPKVYGRTKIANDSEWLPDCDGRTLIAKRYREKVKALLVDHGGADQCSEECKTLITQFAAAAVLAEQMHAAMAKGADINVANHALLSSTLIRLGNKLGINRDLKPDGRARASAARAAPAEKSNFLKVFEEVARQAHEADIKD